MGKKITSISIDESIWKQAKRRALDLDVTVGAYLEGLISRDIEKPTK